MQKGLFFLSIIKVVSVVPCNTPLSKAYAMVLHPKNSRFNKFEDTEKVLDNKKEKNKYTLWI